MGQARVENRTLVHHQRGCDLVESGQRYPLYEMVEELMFQGISLIQNDLLASHFQKSFADDENANEIDRALNFSLIACCKVGFLGLCFSNSTARSLSGSRWPRSGKIMAKKKTSATALRCCTLWLSKMEFLASRYGPKPFHYHHQHQQT